MAITVIGEQCFPKVAGCLTIDVHNLIFPVSFLSHKNGIIWEHWFKVIDLKIRKCHNHLLEGKREGATDLWSDTAAERVSCKIIGSTMFWKCDQDLHISFSIICSFSVSMLEQISDHLCNDIISYLKMSHRVTVITIQLTIWNGLDKPRYRSLE